MCLKTKMRRIKQGGIFKKLGPFQLALTSLLFILSSLFSLQSFAQKDIPTDFCISSEEKKLFDQINMLLKEYDKKPLQASTSLYYVAKKHVEDLINNNPDTSICNLSSWSDKGDWTPCCHNPYVPQQDCMWDKPNEMTRYPYRGYELVSYFEDDFNADSVIQMWSSSKKVLDMLLTNGNFEKKKWVCMGVGMNANYASVWFGQRPDRENKPILCDTNAIETISAVVSKPTDKVTYYLIVGSFEDMKDAKEFLRRLKKNGYEHAGLYKDKQNHRIYVNEYTDLKEAMFAKKQLPYTYKDAWVFKK